MAEVLVLGGGFGGLAAANELRSLLTDEDTITLVDRSDRFAMGFAKLWDLSGLRPIDEGTRSLDSLERQGVGFLRADITGIDPGGRQVETTAGTLLADALVVALGATPDPRHRAWLEGDGAHDLYDIRALPAIRRDLDTVDAGRVLVAILGTPFKCPPAPYEAALIVDELLRGRGVRDTVEVAVATPQPMTLPVAGPDASRYVADHLADHGVELLSDRVVRSVDPGHRTIAFEDGSELSYDLLLGVPADAPLSVIHPLAGGTGWIEPDRATFRTAFERVYAVGDCTHVPTAKGALPHAGVFAAAAGRVAARNIVADLSGGPEAVFDGHGFCFLELPGQRVAFVEGDFYADPQDVTISQADEEQFRRKQAYERDHLDAWLG